MKYRSLGKTGFNVSEIGMGTWQLAGQPWGWDPPDEKESLRALNRFVELGGNFIDTAWVYGRTTSYKKLGLHSSEELIGKFLKESMLRDKVIIATKIPPKNRKWPAWRGIGVSEVFPGKYIERYVDSSLRNLKVDTIDLMQFHVWQDDFAKDEGWKRTIQRIVKSGKVRFWGISINDYQPINCLNTLDTGLIDTIQLIFNIFHQKPVEKLFPYARKHKIGLIARVPLDEGGLTNRLMSNTKFADPLRSVYFRKDRLVQVIERVKKLEMLLNKEAENIPELALRFNLSFPEISTVIPGTRKVKYVEENTSVSDGRKLTKMFLNELKKHAWERN